MEKSTKKIHIGLLLVGSIFILLSVFHTNLWFDESYSVAIAKHNFVDIWQIGGHDVHPVLYYWMLKILNLIFGNNILVYRLFSAIPVILMGILGFTHIKKDFGEKTGLYFSFLSFFLPINIVYAGEVRMYTWAMLFVSIMCIYAYRIWKNDKNIKKNWILFGITSLASAYTHYYGLLAAGVVNLFLFISIVLQANKEKKFIKPLRYFIISALVQVALYIPWLIYFVLQLTQVSRGFWIGFRFPETFVEMFSFQYTGNLGDTIHIPQMFSILFGIVMTAYIVYLLYKNKKKENIEPAKLSIWVYAGVLLIAGIVSLIMEPILYARYMLAITGIFIFFIAFLLAKLGKNKINLIFCTLILITSIAVNINLMQTNYDKTNKEPIEYMREKIQSDDIFIYTNEGSGFVISANFPENKQYFYDKQHWNVEEAYKAYGPNMKTIYDLGELKDFKGRIWLINAGNYALLEELQTEYNVNVIEKQGYSIKYQNYKYTFALVEKE